MPPDDLTSRPVAGRYDLGQLLGRGGMGSVWRATDLLLQRPVAVKRVELPLSLAPEDREALRQRVLREARAAARVSHPRLVTVFDVVEEEETVFLVQELVDAPTLKAVVLEQGPRDPVEVARIGRQLTEGLASAHRGGVVHRDVKPANVMVLADGGVKLADFGIASLTGDPQLTATGMIIGSPAFMAPEQATGDRTGAAADLWSLGATLYFAVEGEPPFGKADTLSTLTAVVHEPPRPTVRAGALGPVLERLLVKDPAARADVIELARLLDAVIAGGQPASPAPAGETAILPPGAVQVERPAPPAPAPAADLDRAAVQRPAPRRAGFGWVTALVVLALVAGLALASVLGGDGDRGGGPDGGSAAPRASTSTAPAPAPPPGPEAATPSASAAPSAAAVPASWPTYTDPDTGYRLAYPGGWRVSERDRTRTDFTDPATGSYLRVDWTDEPGDSPEGAWKAQSKDFGSRHDNYREIRIEPTTYQGHRAALWEYTYQQGGASLHAYNLGFVTNDYGFALNFQAQESQWEASQPLWEQLKAGFQVPVGD